MEPWRPLIVPPRPRGSTEGLMRGTVQPAAAGLEELTAIVVLPEVAGMAAVVPADRERHIFVWGGQPLPPGVTEGMVRRLGPKPDEWLEQQTALRNALFVQARKWYGSGIRHLLVVRPEGRSVASALKATLGLEVKEVTVSEGTIEEAIVQLAQAAGFPPPADEDLSEAAHQVRDYGRMS